ncbi:MAG: hypothetical protein P4L56_06315 [Candidatus Sulfopaludibacter sp.]|nr:hypothetical protein [Candidatus Sulfopaludibacter sp.]
MILPEEIEALDEAFSDVRAFAGEVRESPSPAAWFRDTLAALVDAAPNGYRLLKLGLGYSTSLAAWACRNLLELNIYTQYVLQSEANARRFALNRVADGIDTFDAFQTWLARNDPSLVPPEAELALRQLSDLRAREEEPAPRLYSLKYLSAEVGLADEYAYMTRFCSKLAQPGVFLVTAAEADLQLFQPVLFRAGAGHGMEIYQAAKDHFAAFGAAPRP